MKYTGADFTLIDIYEETCEIDVELLKAWLVNNPKTEAIDDKSVTTENVSGKKWGNNPCLCFEWSR